jgi:hypothetical protein
MLIKKLDAKISLFMKYHNIIMIFPSLKSGSQRSVVSCQPHGFWNVMYFEE